MTGACYRCGWQGHTARDCPHSLEVILAVGTMSQTEGQTVGESSSPRDQGIGGREGSGEQTSTTMIIIMISVCFLELVYYSILVLFIRLCRWVFGLIW